MEIVLKELGYFGERTAKKLCERLAGATYMNIQVSYSNWCGNCTLILKTDYEAKPEEIKNLFLNVALNDLIG